VFISVLCCRDRLGRCRLVLRVLVKLPIFRIATNHASTHSFARTNDEQRACRTKPADFWIPPVYPNRPLYDLPSPCAPDPGFAAAKHNHEGFSRRCCAQYQYRRAYYGLAMHTAQKMSTFTRFTRSPVFPSPPTPNLGPTMYKIIRFTSSHRMCYPIHT